MQNFVVDITMDFEENFYGFVVLISISKAIGRKKVTTTVLSQNLPFVACWNTLHRICIQYQREERA